MADIAALDNDCLRYVKTPLEHNIVIAESSMNPYAIGVVGARLERQPKNKAEAIATALSLRALGYNYSMGCRQINQSNLAKYGLTHETVFDAEKNSEAGDGIYDECHTRAVAKFGEGEAATKATLSCYYSGNFTDGLSKEGNAPSYVGRVLGPQAVGITFKAALAIPVVASKPIKAKQAERKPEATGAADAEVPPQADSKQPASWDVFKEF